MDLSALREDFPLFAQRPELVYLDSAATSQKPRRVIEALRRYYETLNANVHRGAYRLSAEATEAYEEARRRLARFLNAEPKEIVFVRNTTEAMNLVAYAWGLRNLKEGDEVLVTEMEHHAGLVPWHLVAGLTGAKVKAIPLTEEGRLDLSALEDLLTERTRVVSLVHMSNVLGTINPVAEIARRAKEAGALVVVDGAQSAPHLPVDVKALGADFFALSGHKMLGPTGAGVLWGRYEVLEGMMPFLGGGEMILEVHVDRSTYAPPPQRFEAGTPPIAEAIAPVKVAAGEHVPNRILFKNYLQAGAMAICQVDAVRVAGVSEFLVISLLAKKFGVPVIPHVGDMRQIHQHLVLFNHIALDHEAIFLEHIPHLQDRFTEPVKIVGARYTTPRLPGTSCELKP